MKEKPPSVPPRWSQVSTWLGLGSGIALEAYPVVGPLSAYHRIRRAVVRTWAEHGMAPSLARRVALAEACGYLVGALVVMVVAAAMHHRFNRGLPMGGSFRLTLLVASVLWLLLVGAHLPAIGRTLLAEVAGP